MKYYILIALFFLAPHAVMAEEFGEYFYDQTPSGMAEFTVESEPDIAMDEIAQDLEQIMPASGEEKDEQGGEDITSKPSTALLKD